MVIQFHEFNITFNQIQKVKKRVSEAKVPGANSTAKMPNNI